MAGKLIGVCVVRLGLLVSLQSILAVESFGQQPAVEDPRRKEADRLAQYALFDRAAQAYAGVLKAAPGDMALRLALAEVHYKDRRFDESQKEFQAVIDGHGSQAQKSLAHACLGDIHRKMEQREQARKEYEAAQQLATGQAGVGFDEATARVKRGLGFVDWQKAEARKTIVWFPADSPMKGTALETAQFIDSRITTVERFSGHPFTGKLEVYYLSTPEQWQTVLGGWNWGGGSPQEKTIYIMVGRTFYNLMRTLSFYLGNIEMKDVPKSTFIANGFASGYCGSKTWGRRIREQVSQMKQQGKLPPLHDLLNTTSDNNTTAALGASFVWFLTKEYGEQKFTDFWRKFNEDDKSLSSVYGKTVAQLEADWLASLGGADNVPIELSVRPQVGGLLVSLTNRGNISLMVTLNYRLFDPNSAQIAEGVAGKSDTALKPGEVVEFPLTLNAAKNPGKYAVRLTVVTDKGERVEKVVDYEVEK